MADDLEGDDLATAGVERLDSVEELLAVHRASCRLQFILDPEELAQEAIRVLEETLGYEYAAVLLLDEHSAGLIPFALSDQGKEAPFVDADRKHVIAHGVRLGRGITGWVADNGKSVRSGDIREDPRYIGLRTGIVSELCVPMRGHGRVIGVVNVETSRPNAYTEADQRVLEIIAAQIAAAVENSRLQRELVHSQRLDALGRLASGIAHDFNNLLTVINGYSELFLGRADLDRELREGLGEVRKAGLRAAEMTRKLLAFGRKSILRPVILDPNEQIASLTNMLRRLVGEDIRLSIRTDPSLSTVEVDPTQFGQIIVNLVVNARDAMPAGGSLAIVTMNEVVAPGSLQAEIVAAGQYCVISVTDSGLGMSAQTQSTLFEPFYSTKQHGTGLGLAMVHGVVRQSGGGIGVESHPGLGTRFKIYLPAVQRPAAAAKSDDATHPVPALGGQILLVEDDATVRNLVESQLESLGYSVVAACGGSEALEIAGRPGIRLSLVVSDIVMPGMDGPEVVQGVRKLHPDIRILYMSGYPARWLDSRGAFVEEGDLISKPFTRSTLKRKLRELL